MGIEECRRQLTGVALAPLSRRLPDKVHTDGTASAAGTSRLLVHHYFPGKPSVYEAASRRAADDSAARFVTSVTR